MQWIIRTWQISYGMTFFCSLSTRIIALNFSSDTISVFLLFHLQPIRPGCYWSVLGQVLDHLLTFLELELELLGSCLEFEMSRVLNLKMCFQESKDQIRKNVQIIMRISCT